MSKMKAFAEKVSGFMGHDGEITEDVENVVALCIEATTERSDRRKTLIEKVTQAAHSMEFTTRHLNSAIEHADPVEDIMLAELHRKAWELRREVEAMQLALEQNTAGL